MPLRLWSAVAEHSQNGSGGALTERGASVLVVQREEPLRALIRRTLESEGCRVLEACDVGEAFAAIGALNRPVDLVVADLVEPGVTGPTGLASRLPLTTRILLLSLFSDDDIAPAGAREGTTVLRNPFRPDALRDKVRELLHDR